MHTTPTFVSALLSLGVSLTAQGLHIGPTEPRDQTTRDAGSTRTRIAADRRGATGIYIKSLRIKATIVDGIASTELSQVFHNAGRRGAEGTWILPLPPGATADHFTMTMNGKQVSGEVLDANEARRIYTGIVRRQRDPGLLEYMGNGCLRARIFPIPPRSDMTVEVRYRQVLPVTAGVHDWSFPLRAAQVGGRAAGHLTLDVSIRSQKAIKNVYSPTPGVDVVRKGDHAARVSLEFAGGHVAQRDLHVFYGVSDRAFGLDLLTHRRKGEPGYFVMMISPKLAWDDNNVLPKCINFVVDASGSMKGTKIIQARGALRFFLNSLNEVDHFNVIPFSTEAQPVFRRPVAATPANLKKALDKAKDIRANGGTNIEQALTTTLSARMPSGKKIVGITVFLTDGRPSVDTTDTKELLRRIQKSNRHGHRIFAFGVGDDVNTVLLDRIAQQSHGDRDYVRPNENIQIKTGALFAKLSHPVMSDVRIDCDGIEGFDTYPRSTPDIFKGTRLLVTGRFKGSGHHSIRLRGVVDGAEKEFIYAGVFPEVADSHEFIPTLWAQRKVAVLLDAIRLNGSKPELVEEIRRLGREHGIVTPHSSHLVLERHARVATARGNSHGGAYRGPGDRVPGPPRPAGPTTPGPGAPGPGGGPKTGGPGSPPTTGSRDDYFMGASKRAARVGGAATAKPIDYSLALKHLAQSRKVGNSARLVTRRIKEHTFHRVAGAWIDSEFVKGMEKRIDKIVAFSAEYFALLKKHPELAKILALGRRIVVVLKERVIEIGPLGK